MHRIKQNQLYSYAIDFNRADIKYIDSNAASISQQNVLSWRQTLEYIFIIFDEWLSDGLARGGHHAADGLCRQWAERGPRHGHCATIIGRCEAAIGCGGKPCGHHAIPNLRVFSVAHCIGHVPHYDATNLAIAREGSGCYVFARVVPLGGDRCGRSNFPVSWSPPSVGQVNNILLHVFQYTLTWSLWQINSLEHLTHIAHAAIHVSHLSRLTTTAWYNPLEDRFKRVCDAWLVIVIVASAERRFSKLKSQEGLNSFTTLVSRRYYWIIDFTSRHVRRKF